MTHDCLNGQTACGSSATWVPTFTDKVVTKQDASDALDLIEAMLDYVYVFSVKFEQFKARRDVQAGSNLES